MYGFLVLTALFVRLIQTIENRFFNDYAHRFPIIDQLLSREAAYIDHHYASDESITSWADEACPSFLVNGDLVVCGNLFVRGKITTLTAANTSVFEERTDLADATGSLKPITPQYKTTNLSLFATKRCSKPSLSANPIVCDVPGNLIIPDSSLLISGRLIVFGSVMTNSLTIDGTASAAIGLSAFLNIMPLQPPSPANATAPNKSNRSTSRSRTSRSSNSSRSTSANLQINQHLPATMLFDSLESDTRCGTVKAQETLVIPRGVLFLRNRASLFTFGKVTVRLVALDKASLWVARCASITVADAEGLGGDVALLGASTLAVSGPSNYLRAGGLVASESSFLLIQGQLEVAELLKVTSGSCAIVGGNTGVYDLVVADSSRFRATRGGVAVSDLALFSNAWVTLGSRLDALSLEVYDSTELTIRKELNVGEYVVVDDGSSITISDGNMYVLGSVLMANASKLLVRSELMVAEDFRGKNSVNVTIGKATVGCSLILSQHSHMSVGRSSLRVRDQRILAYKGSEDSEAKDTFCQKEAPILYVTHSTLAVREGISVGGRQLAEKTRGDGNSSDIDGGGNGLGDGAAPQVSILTSSKVAVGYLESHCKKHALVMKGRSKMLVQGVAEKVFYPGQLITMEGSSQLKLVDMEKIEFRALEMSDGSKFAVEGGILMTLDTMLVRSRSSFDTKDCTDIRIGQIVEVSEESSASFTANNITFGRPFNHVMTRTGSKVEFRSRIDPMAKCTQSLNLNDGNFVAQDGAGILFQLNVTGAGVVTAETNSLIYFHCPLGPENIRFRRTPEARIQNNPTMPAIQSRIYKVKVPPSDASSLLHFKANSQSDKVKQKQKNLFWDHWTKSISAEDRPTALSN